MRQVDTRSFLKQFIGLGLLFGLPFGLFGCGTTPTSTGTDTSTIATQSLCIEHTNIELHYHPLLSILINGEAQNIPKNTGIEIADDGETITCMHATHTHTDTGTEISGFTTIHVETPDTRTVTLGDFFTIWGETFTSTQILDSVADDTHEILLSVDGELSTDYGNLALSDGQIIVISYQEK